MLTAIDKPDIVVVIEAETGNRLRGKGQALWMLCPFHSEKTPSLKVNPDKQTWYCFGCNEGGDVLTFIQKFKGLSFPEALRYLGIESDKPYKPNPEVERRKKLLEQFRTWEREYFDEVVSQLRLIGKIMSGIKTDGELEKLAALYKLQSVLDYHGQILTFGNDEERFELYKEIMRDEN
jgi:DNA primase